MSYCRSAQPDSDVYLIGTFNVLECFGAGWQLEDVSPVHERIQVPDWGPGMVKLSTTHEAAASFCSTSRKEMIEHLLAHRAAGHKVPDYAIERLQEEIIEDGDLYP